MRPLGRRYENFRVWPSFFRAWDSLESSKEAIFTTKNRRCLTLCLLQAHSNCQWNFLIFFVHVVKLLEHHPQKFQGKIPIFVGVRLLHKWKMGDSLKSPGLDAVFHSKLKFPTGWVHGHYYQPPIILIGTLWKILEMFSSSMTRVSEGLEWVGIFFWKPRVLEC